MLTMFSAIRAEAASIILPSNCAAPFPSLDAFSNSSKILFALLTSVSGGEKTSFASFIWEGCIAHLPSIPIAAPLLAAAIYASGSLKSPNGPSIALNP